MASSRDKARAAEAVANATGNRKVGSAIGGAAKGAATGAAIGSAVPVLGTALGGIVGGGLGALDALIPNRKDAERKANAESALRRLYDADPANDAAALAALEDGARNSATAAGKQFFADALQQHQTGAVNPSIASGAAAGGAAAPAAPGGGLLGGIGSTLRRLNGGRALTLGNLAGGAARNLGGAVGGAAGAVGSALGGLGGLVKDNLGTIAGAGLGAMAIPEMNRANRLRDAALGAVPEEGALPLPTSLDVDAGGVVNPEDSARLGRYRSLTDASVEGLQGPSRTELARTALDDFRTSEGRAGDAAFRRATQLAAAKGGLGSGMLTSSYGDVATQIGERELAYENELARSVAEGDIGDRFRRLDVTAGLEGGVSAEEAARRGELRGERGYATGIAEGNINRRLGAADAAFGRGVTRAGVRSDFANAADQRAAGFINAGADLIGGAADRRAYENAMPRPAVTPQVGVVPTAVPQVGALPPTMRPLPPVAGMPTPTAPIAGPRPTLNVASVPMQPAVLKQAPTTVAAPPVPTVTPMINTQLPLPPAGAPSVPGVRPRGAPATRRRLMPGAGGL